MFRRLSGALIAIAMVSLTTDSHAQQLPTDRILIGDGAAECAAAKKAFAARAPRNNFSVASANFDATYYHLDLLVPMTNDSVMGGVRVEGRVINSTMTQLTLDLAQSMNISSVGLAGVQYAYTHTGAALTITLPSPQAVGSLVQVVIGYRGIPVTNGFGNFVFGTRTNGDRYAWSLSEPYGAREWWPCKDHPSDKADSVRVTIEVPSEYRVGSQGVLDSVSVAGPNTIYDWKSNYPISSYLISVAIGKYVQHDELYIRPGFLEADYGPLSMPLVHLRYDDGTSELPSGWAVTADALEVQEDWFGPYPFANEKYGHSEFTFGGGMEHQTMSSLGSGSASVVVHELAHQWYGDSISPKRWAHLWLNEGFATYAELIFWKEREATYPGNYDVVLESRLGSAREATGTLVLQDTTNVNSMFDGARVYSKGGMVLYMLHGIVGDTVFKQIMQDYAADPAVQYGNALTADFQRVAEATSGMDLDYFFEEWVTQGTGYPTYGATSTWQETGSGYHVWLTLSQAQTLPQSNTPVFEMPVEILVNTAGADTLFVVHNNQRTQIFEFDVADKPVSVQVDPSIRILRGDVISTVTQPLPKYPTISSMGPNPTASNLQLQYLLDRQSTVEISVFNVAGQRVMTQKFSEAAGVRFADIDTAPLPSGVYFLRLSTVQGTARTKFVVLR